MPLTGTIWADGIWADIWGPIWGAPGGGGGVQVGDAECDTVSGYPRYRIWLGERWSRWKRAGYADHCP